MNDNFWQILIAVFGGSGVWELIKFEVEKHKKKLSDEEKLMLGIAHDRIWSLGGQYLRRKGITKSYMGKSVGKEHRFLMANDIMGIFNKAGI